VWHTSNKPISGVACESFADEKKNLKEKNSVLGSRDKVNMLNVNLGQLAKGKSCSILCIIFRNKFQVLGPGLFFYGRSVRFFLGVMERPEWKKEQQG
jgi:hypothetical protein